jgi:hypothetical protein
VAVYPTPRPAPCGARLPGHYGAEGDLRPRRGARHKATAEGVGRFFVCERCRDQVLICSCCDRGQIYCASGCAKLARSACRRKAAQRYQASRKGRFAHAKRSRRYRARCKNVTHQGSPDENSDVSVSVASAAARISARDSADTPSMTASPGLEGPLAATLRRHCHWCGRYCSPFVRREPLRRRRAVRDPPS